MSQENVELFRQVAAAWNRRDLEAWLGFAQPEIEWGARRFWADTNATFDQLVTDYEEVPVQPGWGASSAATKGSCEWAFEPAASRS